MAAGMERKSLDFPLAVKNIVRCEIVWNSKLKADVTLNIKLEQEMRNLACPHHLAK